MKASSQSVGQGGIVRDSAYAWYVAGVLAICQTVSFIDRQLISLLIGPIKADYGLSDTSVSLLIGVAFTIIHILLAIPLGRTIDRGHRRAMILVCGIAWSLSSMMGGLAHSYAGLFVSRMGVGAAEAGIYPACAALIAAYFSPAKLPRAMSISLLGPFVGSGCALIFGGIVIGAFERIGHVTVPIAGLLKPWQMTLVVISAVGILPILLVLTVREPAPETSQGEPAKPVPFAEALAFLRERRAFYGIFYPAITAHVMAIYAVPAWAPSLLIRRFGLDTAQAGVRFGVVALVAGVSGMLAGPWLARLLGRRDPAAGPVRGMRVAVLLTALLAMMLPLPASAGQMLALLAAIIFTTTLPMPLASAVLMGATPDRLRGFIGAIYFVLASLVGLAIAPTLVGFATDHLFRDPRAVGSSMALVLGLGGMTSFLLMLRLPATR